MKREPVGNGHERDGWLGNTLRRSPASDAKACVDAETLAAWADGGLSSQSAAAVELHAATCSRCMAVLGALGRTVPEVPARPAWSPRRGFRWLVPLTAAATAIAIWVVVPDRPMTPVSTTLSQDIQLKSEQGSRSDRSKAQGQSTPDPRPNADVDLNADANRNPDADRNRNPPPTEEAAAPQDQFQARDELRRADPPSIGATAGAAEPQAPPPAPAAPSARAASANALKESVADPLIRWRIVPPSAVERSRDGGKTWSRTISPVPPPAAVRAVDADRAVVTGADGAMFYTTDGGAAWTRVQENSAAPF